MQRKDAERLIEQILYYDNLTQVTSLSAQVKGADKDTEIGEFIEDMSPGPYEIISQQESAEQLNKLLEKYLTSREMVVIKFRFGFEGDRMTLEEIGEKYGVTRERIRQIEEKTLKKLRRIFARNNIKMEDFL